MTKTLLSRRAQLDARKSILDRQVHLNEFVDCYENLVEGLCDAAQYGPNPKLARNYVECRQDFQTRYTSLRPFLISYLEFDTNDAEAGLKLIGRPLDAFEALVAAIDLHEFFKMDDGCMISRITRTREALTLYGEHLRLLAMRMV